MRISLVLITLLLLPPASAAAPSALAEHPSPYLAMHADDPVQWRLWDQSALQAARRQGRLLFVSSGYFACHWCHVMQRESFRDPAIAAYINDHFVPVKLDRELSPALDAYLIDFVERTAGRAGWPLNVFLTPAGAPLVGTTYQPPEAFLTFLRRLQARWRAESSDLSRLAARAAAQQTAAPGASAQPLAADLARRAGEHFLAAADARADRFAGGFGEQSKFPAVPQLLALLELAPGQVQWREFLQLTLEAMATQGLHDLVGGGFFRYTVGPDWQEPHFEKMLYDNALLATLYLRAGAALGESRFHALGEQTLRFLGRAMAHPDGGYIASLSALDARGIEGGYYLWSRRELEAVLSPEQLRVVGRLWDLDGSPLLEHGDLPVQAADAGAVADALGLSPAHVRRIAASARERLQQARAARGLPADGKRLTAWNALVLNAFAAAVAAGADEALTDAGEAQFQFLHDRLTGPEGARRGLGPEGHDLGPGELADYVFTAAAMLEWARARDEPRARARATVLLGQAWKRFFSGAGFRPVREGPLELPARSLWPDGPLPSAAGTFALAALRLSATGDAGDWRARARSVLGLDPEGLLAEPFDHATYVRALHRLSQQRAGPSP